MGYMRKRKQVELCRACLSDKDSSSNKNSSKRPKTSENVLKSPEMLKKLQELQNARKCSKTLKMFSRSHRAAKPLTQPPPQPQRPPLRLPRPPRPPLRPSPRPLPRGCRAAAAAGAIFFKALLGSARTCAERIGGVHGDLFCKSSHKFRYVSNNFWPEHVRNCSEHACAPKN